MGSSDSTLTKVSFPGNSVASIAFNEHSYYVLDEAGALFVAGNNECGQLGLGDENEKNGFWKLDFRQLR